MKNREPVKLSDHVQVAHDWNKSASHTLSTHPTILCLWPWCPLGEGWIASHLSVLYLYMAPEKLNHENMKPCGCKRMLPKDYCGQSCKNDSKLLLLRTLYLCKVHPRGRYYVLISFFWVFSIFFGFSRYDLIKFTLSSIPFFYFCSNYASLFIQKTYSYGRHYEGKLIQELSSFLYKFIKEYEILKIWKNSETSRKIS